MSFDLFAVAAVILILLLAGVLYLLPSEKMSKKKWKRLVEKAGEDTQKDWREACLKMEKHIHALRGQIEQGKVREKNFEKEVLIQKTKNKKMQEKLSQERGWQEKELTEVEKRTDAMVRLRQDLQTAEQDLHKEHGDRLRLERELKEIKESLATANNVQRSLETQIAKGQAQAENDRKEIMNLRVDNAKLSKQHDEVTWIAKSEYVKLEKQLRQIEQDFAKFKSQVKREGI